MRRRDELAENLQAARGRIAAACHAAGRSVDSVTMVAVTKTWPASDVELLAELGVTHFAENRDQEARAKVAQVRAPGVTWHFVGQVQRNKAVSIAGYCDVVESVDRQPLVAALERGAQDAGRRLGLCVQVDLDAALSGDLEAGDQGADPGGPAASRPAPPRARGGAAPGDVVALARTIAESPSLDLLGVMAVAPLGMEPGPAFARLAALHREVLDQFPAARVRSAGMSGDLEEAILHGATHLRLGGALLGHRQRH